MLSVEHRSHESLSGSDLLDGSPLQDQRETCFDESVPNYTSPFISTIIKTSGVYLAIHLLPPYPGPVVGAAA